MLYFFFGLRRAEEAVLPLFPGGCVMPEYTQILLLSIAENKNKDNK